MLKYIFSARSIFGYLWFNAKIHFTSHKWSIQFLSVHNMQCIFYVDVTLVDILLDSLFNWIINQTKKRDENEVDNKTVKFSRCFSWPAECSLVHKIPTQCSKHIFIFHILPHSVLILFSYLAHSFYKFDAHKIWNSLCCCWNILENKKKTSCCSVYFLIKS